jgi:outer membrane lipoprotein
MPLLNRTLAGTIFAAATLVLFTGCATVPTPLAGDFPDFQPEQSTERSVGARIRWGGTIVDTRPGREATCVEILARELDRDMRPKTTGIARGRFLACREGFKDPAVFYNGREITVIGRLSGFTEAKIGEFEYRYPRVDADVFYLWAERPDVIYHYYDPWWYSPWGPYYRYPYRAPRTRVSGHIIIGR